MSPDALQVVVLLALAAAALPVVVRLTRSTWMGEDRIPVTAWGWPEGLFTAGLAGFFLLMAFGGPQETTAKVDLRAVLSSIGIYGSLCVFVLGFLFFRNLRPVEAFRLGVREFPAGLAIGLPAMLLALPFVFLVQIAAYHLAGAEAPPQPIVTFLLESTRWTDRAAVAFVAIVAAPVTEEIIFRGCVYGVSRKFAGRLAALFFSSVVFAVIHGHLASLPGLFLLSLALTLAYERSGSLWAPITMHAAFNGLNVVLAIWTPDLLR